MNLETSLDEGLNREQLRGLEKLEVQRKTELLQLGLVWVPKNLIQS